jgi:hypothetical protein
LVLVDTRRGCDEVSDKEASRLEESLMAYEDVDKALKVDSDADGLVSAEIPIDQLTVHRSIPCWVSCVRQILVFHLVVHCYHFANFCLYSIFSWLDLERHHNFGFELARLAFRCCLSDSLIQRKSSLKRKVILDVRCFPRRGLTAMQRDLELASFRAICCTRPM